MAVVDDNPLTGQLPEEVLLKNAPLIRVLAQVRFPSILSIEDKGFVAPFQESIRDIYPILQPEQTGGVLLGTQGFTQIWRFIDNSGNWRVSLASDFLALETTTYSSRSDFLKRFERVLFALSEHINPQIVDRFGLRYINRLLQQDIVDLSKFVRPEIAGIITTGFEEQINQMISEALFKFPEGEDIILVQWGLLPAKATIAQGVVEPINEPSWVLDLDMSLTERRKFDVQILMPEAQKFAERIYTFFRWVVTTEFLRRFGGEL
ncbi:MAG: TIGR04255 family protein [Symploca sp. SIO1B1]|nr:TIGR04255 family protein [Symploca sp. SIO1C2]NER97060.1 TIGR04255 family protein [Symploca sp. SIO1B1]